MKPAEARAAMVARLRSAGTLSDAAVTAAMASVPRHRFIEQVSVENAYADVAVAVKADETGRPISSASQPTMVATMLELAELEPGHRVLEIGTGTGYNAALLAHIVGPTGHVVTIELEPDLADRARARLTDLGLDLDLDDVEVIVGDGAVGHPAGAPFDRVMVTAGAAEPAEPWSEQLRPGGRLVVPVVGADGIGVVQCLVRQPSGLVEVARVPCGFLPMRSRPSRRDRPE